MTIALDAGAFCLRSLRRHGGRLVARRCRTIAAFIEDNDARRRWLKAARIPHLVAESSLVIPGDAAVEAAGLCDIAPDDLLPDGELPKADAVTRQVIAALVDGLLPRALNRGAACCFSQPGHPDSPASDDALDGRRLEFFTQVIRLRGYTAIPLNPATALVLAELSQAGFTGLGVALGASGCDLAVVHRGNQIASARLPFGGRWLDEQIARQQRIVRRHVDEAEILDLDEARKQKETAPGAESQDGVGGIVAELYAEILAELSDALAGLLNSHPRISLLEQPLPVICSGGPALRDGFEEALQGALDRCDTSVELGRVQMASEPEYAVARGCLIKAEIEAAAGSTRTSRREARPTARARTVD